MVAKFNVHIAHKTIAVFVLLIGVLIALLLIVGGFMTASNDSSFDGTVHVKNEKELTSVINKAKNPIIQLDNDITLTKPLVISAKKDVTLTSNTIAEKGFFKLVGATNQNTLNVGNGGVLHLAGIIITHKTPSEAEMYVSGLGVNVTDGGKLFMSDGEISGKWFWRIL